MESLAVDPKFWNGRRVLITGHTGFKGAWLALWLTEMRAEVTGLALEPATMPSLFELLGLCQRVPTIFADINNRAAVEKVIIEHRPEIIFHLAAQSLVRPSYKDPVSTFATNALGVVTLLDIVRASPTIRAVVIATSDKCYDNQEWVWAYRENDRLGGRDPYSASKGCAEIIAAAMRRSFFVPYAVDGHRAQIATVRAGNVIGGGDWAQDRLVPDLVRGCLGPEGLVKLRNPTAIRPWQHVLEPLSGYLQIGQLLMTSANVFDEAWNFGPEPSDDRAVIDVAQAFVTALGVGRIITETDAKAPHEAQLLRLDCAKAKAKLGWRPRLRFHAAIERTVSWYSSWTKGADMIAVTRNQIAEYMELSRTRSASRVT